MKNAKISFIEEALGVKFPEFGLYNSSREVSSEQTEKDGVLYPSKWEFKSGNHLPYEFEQFLPKEGMTPLQAVKQMDVCSEIARGWANDSHRIYGQGMMVAFLNYAISNCLYLASQDFSAWNESYSKHMTYLGKVEREFFVFHEAFSREKPYRYENEMNRLYLRLLLENNVQMEEGNVESDGKRHGNELFGYLFSTIQSELWMAPEDFKDSMGKLLIQKCYELTLELNKIS